MGEEEAGGMMLVGEEAAFKCGWVSLKDEKIGEKIVWSDFCDEIESRKFF